MSDKKQSLLSKIFKSKKSSCCNQEIVDEDENKKEKSSCCSIEIVEEDSEENKNNK